MNKEVKNSHYVDDYLKLTIEMANYFAKDGTGSPLGHAINYYILDVSSSIDVYHLVGTDEVYTL